jgi:molybdate transport system substrate-binding protein
MWIPRQFSAALLILALLPWPASAATLTVLSPASVAPGLEAIAALYTAQNGTQISVGGGARDKVLEALKKGSADVVVLPSSDFADLTDVTAMLPLGRIVVGVAVKAGTKVPDISTAEKFRSVLLAAKGVAYADPAAGTSAGKMIETLLQSPEFAGVKRVPVRGLAVTALINGTADIALQLLPELSANKDVALAGPVPEAYGLGVDFSAGITTSTSDAMDAQSFVSFLSSSQNADLWKKNGLAPLSH